MRRLLCLAAFAALLAGCAPAAAAPTPTASIPTATPAPPTATLPPSPTPTPTAVPTPTATPLPRGLARLLNALASTWGVSGESITTTAASAEETAQLAEALGVEADSLGQVYKVEAAGATFYASAETGKSYAIRQAPAYFKYEMGKEVDVPAHAEGVEVVRLVDEPTEFSHWGEGKVVEVVYANGEHGWIYQGENGEWQKIYESGFDYEFLSRLVEHFKEVTGKDYRDWAEGVMGGGISPARLDIEQVHRRDKAQWVTAKYIGFHVGAGWVHREEGNFLVEVEAFPMWNRDKGRNETALIPVLVGVEQNGEWNDLIGRELNLDGSLRGLPLSGDEDSIEPSEENLVGILLNDVNIGKAELAKIVVYMDKNGTVRLGGKGIDDKEAAKYGYVFRVSEFQVILLKAGFPDWAVWFGNLPVEEQIELMKVIRQRGMLPVAVYEDDPALEESLQRRGQTRNGPAGFFVWGLDLFDGFFDKSGWSYP